MKQTAIRHIIRVADGTLVTQEGERCIEVTYRKLQRLNTLKALEAAFAGMGFRLIERTPDEVVYERHTKRGANPMSKTCTVPGCEQPRMTNRKGKPLTMCEAHQKAYWREHKSRANGGGKRGRTSEPAAAPVLPPPHSRCISASSRCAAPFAGSSSPIPMRCSTSRGMRSSAAGARTRLWL